MSEPKSQAPGEPTGFHSESLAYLESLDGPAPRPSAGNGRAVPAPADIPMDRGTAHKQAAVAELIMAYRSLGHRVADIDPIGVMRRGEAPELELSYFDLSEADLDLEFDMADLAGGGRATLREIVAYLETLYCGPVGYETRHITVPEPRRWLREQIEVRPPRPLVEPEERRGFLQKLTAAEGLEKYLHTKYVGQKRFSLEGGDALIPMLSESIQWLGGQAVKEVVIGMAHRGRLNVLVNVLGKSPADLFSEFEGSYSTADEDTETGDVKYHQGASSDISTPGGNVHVALSFNPSHLEIINPVVEGSVRARQERRHDTERKEVVPFLIHGDAAFAGQGVVMETLQMSHTRGFSTGGTLHIIINNQIGFTTNTLDARSTLYCTEVAKMVQAPIFHVNGDDPDAVITTTRLALEYRMRFGGDVVLDLVCYRRHGHNEADEPAITQPIMYQSIRKHPTPRQIYAERLIEEGVIERAEAESMSESYRTLLDQGQVVAGQVVDPNKSLIIVDWSPYLGKDWAEPVKTGVAKAKLLEFAGRLAEAPEDFGVHRQVRKLLDGRVAMCRGEQPLDWGCAEVLAYASLLHDGYPVRLSGQDVGRGTFSHRHVTLHDQTQARTHIPLQYLTERPSDFLVINSLLSEEAVLGFEYGYATTEPRTLVLWEAQFGDFVNGAQVVIDQFISSGEAKWARVCGLTMLLPHGLEGQGPEHSSARPERFLQLCAENNMQVCVPTTPAQVFHMLRRQMLRSTRRPLIVMTPKSLLRHKLAVSPVEDLVKGEFQPVIGEMDNLNAKAVERLVLCTGKVYYDLLEARRERGIKNIALIRLEQIHPFPRAALEAELAKYPNAKSIIWCQEEPKNQGFWYQIYYYLRRSSMEGQEISYVGREGSPAPAVGYYQLHLAQQQKIIDAALAAAAPPVHTKVVHAKVKKTPNRRGKPKSISVVKPKNGKAKIARAAKRQKPKSPPRKAKAA